MNSILYHQKKRGAFSAQKVYIGEDAYPYADSEILIVADGLGGRGGYPHTKINRDILEKELFYDIVFAPVFTEAVSDEFKEFAVNSFWEIFESKDYYFEVPYATKHSGYFASRFATAITLYELKYNKEFEKKALFEAIKACADEERAAFIQSIGDKLATLIREKLTVIAENVGFEVETSVIGAYLLPSTLTVAYMNEQDDKVDVLYLWAGDSRAYLWNSEGLGQITEDHEYGETMTNLITLTKPFRIEARLVSVAKPCLLLNASDGCYKCMAFDSPFDLEYIFLKSIEMSDDFAASSAFLAEQFAALGKHDDSNTMALHAFGYQDYEGVRSAVKERLKSIDETVIAKLPGILQINYPHELSKVEEEIGKSTLVIKDDLFKEQPVIDFVKADMHEKCAQLIKEKQILTDKLNTLETRRAAIPGEIKTWLCDHWTTPPCMKKYSSAADKLGGIPLKPGHKDVYDRCRCLAEEFDALKAEHSVLVEEALERFRTTSSDIEAILLSLIDIRAARTFDEKEFDDEQKALKETVKFITTITDSKQIAKFKKVKAELYSLQASVAERDDAAVGELLAEILSGKLALAVTLPEGSDIDAISALIEEYRAIADEKEAVHLDISLLDDKYLTYYWEENNARIISDIRANHPELIPESILATVASNIGELEAKREEMKRCCEVREQIYADYDVAYRRLYEESKI